MAAFAQKREIQFIALYVILMLFLGISKETTQFIFPKMGDEIYRTVNFYFLSSIALMSIIAWLALSHNIPQVPKVPPLWAVGVNFLIFFPIFFILLNYLFTGRWEIWIPPLESFIIETIISFNENFIAFILLPTLIPWGKGIGTIAAGKIATIRGYTFSYTIPTLGRLIYGLPSIIVISLLHVGSYSRNVTSLGDFYTAISIAFVMFSFFYFLKETFGFGSSEAAHDAWNLTLISVRGSVI